MEAPQIKHGGLLTLQIWAIKKNFISKKYFLIIALHFISLRHDYEWNQG